LADEGRFPEAIKQYQAALQIEPNAANFETDYGNAWQNLDTCQSRSRIIERRCKRFPIHPSRITIWPTLSLQLPENMPEVIAAYQTALRLKPDYVGAHNNLGVALAACRTQSHILKPR
jgi:tetratricopeptide (TPR) repeat protein